MALRLKLSLKHQFEQQLEQQRLQLHQQFQQQLELRLLQQQQLHLQLEELKQHQPAIVKNLAPVKSTRPTNWRLAAAMEKAEKEASSGTTVAEDASQTQLTLLNSFVLQVVMS